MMATIIHNNFFFISTYIWGFRISHLPHCPTIAHSNDDMGIHQLWQLPLFIGSQLKSATSCGEIADAESLTSLCSECYWAVTHATRSSEGSQGCRED